MYWVVLELPIWGQVLVGMSITITHYAGSAWHVDCPICMARHLCFLSRIFALHFEDLSSKTQFLLSIVGATSHFF